MPQDIPEKDWRVWREMKPHLLQKQCEKTLSRLRGILDKPQMDAHDTYLILCKTVQEEDK